VIGPIVFDAYGTLFDLKAAAKPIIDRFGPDGESLFDKWRDLQLKYAWLSTLRDEYVPFDRISREAFEDLVAEFNLSAELTGEFMEAIGRAPAYVGAPAHLRELKASGIPLSILSNGTTVQLKRLVEAAGLGNLFNSLISVDEARAYKPSPKAYAIGTETYSCEPKQILFVSSNPWDARGAARFGYQVAWLRRGGQRWPPSFPTPQHVIEGLDELHALRA
jgi:2-haloacid dehalogenase